VALEIVLVTVIDVALLFLTVIWGVFFIVYVGRAFVRKRSVQDILWILSIVALFIVGAALLLYDFAGLQLFSTAVAGMFVAGFFAAGVLAAEYRGRFGTYYAVYVILMVVVYGVLKWVGGPFLPPLLAVHVLSGLIIVVLPAIAAIHGRRALWLVSLGGVLISVAGVALTALSMGSPILSANIVLLIAVPIIFLSTLFMTLGPMLTKQWLNPK
jgi:hypothetical protein